MPELIECGSEFNIPAGMTAGEAQCRDSEDASPLPVDNPRSLGKANVVGSGTDSPWGEHLMPSPLNDLDPWWDNVAWGIPPEIREPTVGRGHLWVSGDDPGTWGPHVRAAIPTACMSSHGIIREAPSVSEDAVFPDNRNIAQSSLMTAHVEEDSETPWGSPVLFGGFLGCDKFRLDIDYETGRVTQSPYHISLFGRDCAFCRQMLVTIDQPCINPSYQYGEGPICSEPHPDRMYDSCSAGGSVWRNVGPAVCRPPRFADDPDAHEYCHWVGGKPAPDHSEACTVERLMGNLVQIILEESDILTRLPFRPVDPRDGLSNSKCEYGCGAFGWELDAGPNGKGIPYNAWPRDNVLRMYEGKCECMGPSGSGNPCHPGVPCRTRRRIEENGEEWYDPWCSCRPMCSPGLTLCEFGDPPQHVGCIGTHEFAWDRRAGSGEHNRIKEAYICFKQRELCDPMNGACDSNPYQDPNSYYNPASTTIVDVEVKIVIEILFRHWDPVNRASCCREEYGISTEDEGVKVTLTGEWCGPIAWGSEGREAWPGYPENPPYPGSQSRKPGAPGSSYSGSFCGNLFTHNGYYDDYLDDPNHTHHGGVLPEPPKRCPSWIGGPKFWCVPWLSWTWKHTPVDTVGPIDQTPNQHTRRSQCWSVEPVRMKHHGCSSGEVFAPPGRESCSKPNCRRGCAVRDDSITFNTPCAGRDGYKPGSTPWGCDQCTSAPPLPTDEFDPVWACCYLSEPGKSGVKDCLNTTHTACSQLPGARWYPEQTCGNLDCNPRGACCMQDSEGDYFCRNDWWVQDCDDQNGIWHEGLTCLDIECPPPPPTGGCCHLDPSWGWRCVPDLTAVECAGLVRGTWYRDTPCKGIACPVRGACCYIDESNELQCSYRTEFGCIQILNGVWHPGLTCEQVDCVPPIERRIA